MKRAVQETSRVLTLFLLTSSLLIACGGGGKDGTTDVGENGLAGGEKDTASSSGKKAGGGKTFYQVPTPDQMFSIITRYDEKPDKKLLLDPKYAKDLVNSNEQALHLGVYSTDLAYTSAFGMGQKALKYFKTVRSLGDKLNVSSAFSDETMKRIEKSVGKKDSLQNISRDTYLEAFKYLEKNDRGETLALLVAGGWTEALYLSVNMVETYDKKDPMVQYIADQYYSFKNLRLFMKKHDDKKSVKEMLKKMRGLQVAYKGVKSKSAGSSKLQEKGGKNVLSGGSKLELTKKDLKKIRKEANALRGKIVGEGKES